MSHPIVFEISPRPATPTLTGAELATISSNVEASVSARVNNLENAEYINNIFISGSGSDLNDGKTSGAPILTAAKMFDLCQPSAYNRVQVTGDVTFSGSHSLRAAMGVLSIEKSSASAVEIGLNNFQAFFFGMSHLRLINLGWAFAAGQAGNVFTSYTPQTSAYFSTNTFTNGASGSGSMFAVTEGGRWRDVDFSNSPITNWAGRVFAGVTSGSDPANFQLLGSQRYFTHVTSG